jgi:hypothetical protein
VRFAVRSRQPQYSGGNMAKSLGVPLLGQKHLAKKTPNTSYDFIINNVNDCTVQSD